MGGRRVSVDRAGGAAGEVGGPPGPDVGGGRGALPWAGLAIAAVVVVLFLPVLLRLRSAIPADDALSSGHGTAYNALWRFWWLQRQAGQWGYPDHCSWVLPPTGAELGAGPHSLFPTIVSLAVVRLAGVVGGYNLMLVGLVVFLGLAFQAFLHRGCRVTWLAATAFAALLCAHPVTLAAAQRGPDGLSAGFLAGALAALALAYARGEFGALRGVPFAAALWGCFWTSYPGTGLVVLAVTLAVPCLELAKLPGSRRAWASKLRFLLPLAAGAATLLLKPGAPPLGPPPRPQEFDAAWQALAGLDPAWVAVAAALALCGCLLPRESRLARGAAGAGLAAFGIGFAVTRLQAAGPPATAAGALEAFRPGGGEVASALVLAMLAAAAIGASALWRSRAAWLRGAALLATGALLWTAHPFLVNASPVRNIRPLVRGLKVKPQWRVLVVPGDDYCDVDDTYQVAIDAPFVNCLALQQELPATDARLARYPRVYLDYSRIWDESWGLELARLNVGYLLIHDPKMLQQLPPPIRDRVLYAGPDGVLVALR